MSLEPEDQRHVTAAQGYTGLGMFLDADAEVDKVDSDVRHLPEVLEVRLQIYSSLQKWELMQTFAKKLAMFDPDDAGSTASWAYATRRADSIEAAESILLGAVEKRPDVAVLHYNLACYECQLGRIEGAKERLQTALTLDPNYRRVALEDGDLEPLWASL